MAILLPGPVSLRHPGRADAGDGLAGSEQVFIRITGTEESVPAAFPEPSVRRSPSSSISLKRHPKIFNRYKDYSLRVWTVVLDSAVNGCLASVDPREKRTYRHQHTLKIVEWIFLTGVIIIPTIYMVIYDVMCDVAGKRVSSLRA